MTQNILDLSKCKTCTHYMETNRPRPSCVIQINEKQSSAHSLKEGRDVSSFCKYEQKVQS